MKEIRVLYPLLWLQIFSGLFVVLTVLSCTRLSTPIQDQEPKYLSPSPTPDKTLQTTKTPRPTFTSSTPLTSTSLMIQTPVYEPVLEVPPCNATFDNLPSGQYLVYQYGSSGTSVVDLEGKVRRDLTDETMYPLNANGRQMWLCSGGLLDGEQETFIDIPISLCNAYVISPDLNLALTVCPTGEPYWHYGRVEVYSLKGDTKTVLMEREDNGYNIFNPQWSPDGKWISVFLAYPDRGPINTNLGKPDAGLYLFDTSCLNDPVICPDTQRGPFKVPAQSMLSYSWSPDSQFIALTSERLEGFEIFDIYSEGIISRHVSVGYGAIGPPFWSPDGKWLAYTRQESTSNNNSEKIYLIPVDGGPSVQLVSGTYIMGWIKVPLPMQIGKAYQITQVGAYLNLRGTPSLSGTPLRNLPPGEWVLILDGPVETDGYRWWKMRSEDGAEGWAIEHPDWYEPVEE
ncbi:hypothetical protein ACFLZW_03665 [Chloroflexota bacterium]